MAEEDFNLLVKSNETKVFNNKSTHLLYRAILKRDSQVLKQILQKHKDIQIHWEPLKCSFRTPLYYACEMNFPQGVEMLLDFGTCFLPLSWTKWTMVVSATSPLVVAVEKKHVQVITILLKHQDIFNQRITQNVDFDFDMLKFPFKYGRTVLHTAAEVGTTEILDLLLDAKADINYNEGYESFFRTPLVSAVLNSNFSTVVHLIKRGARLDIKDDLGVTVMYYAKTPKMKQCLLEPNKPILEEKNRIYNCNVPLIKQLEIDQDLCHNHGGLAALGFCYYPCKLIEVHKGGKQVAFSVLFHKKPVVKKEEITLQGRFTITAKDKTGSRESDDPTKLDQVFQEFADLFFQSVDE